MTLILYFMGWVLAFLGGMTAYHDIHVKYMNRAQAKSRRQRDHRRSWCACRVV